MGACGHHTEESITSPKGSRVKITDTMRWALEEALREALMDRKFHYGTASYIAVIGNSIALCEKTNGKEGVRESTLLAALRIACVKLDMERENRE